MVPLLINSFVYTHNSNLDNSNSRLLQLVHKVVTKLYKVETTL